MAGAAASRRPDNARVDTSTASIIANGNSNTRSIISEVDAKAARLTAHLGETSAVIC